MRRSRSSRFMGGPMGKAWARPPGPASPAQALRIISMLASKGLPARSPLWPKPGKMNGLVFGSDIQSPGTRDECLARQYLTVFDSYVVARRIGERLRTTERVGAAVVHAHGHLVVRHSLLQIGRAHV